MLATKPSSFELTNAPLDRIFDGNPVIARILNALNGGKTSIDNLESIFPGVNLEYPINVLTKAKLIEVRDDVCSLNGVQGLGAAKYSFVYLSRKYG